ncbi:hypothetical protein D3C87_1735330 [compost metagenome]
MVPRMPATTSRSPAMAAALNAKRLASAEIPAGCSSVSATSLEAALLLETAAIKLKPSTQANANLFLFTTYLR